MNLRIKITTILSILIIILVALFSYYYKDDLYEFYSNIFEDDKGLIINHNNYYKNKNYSYVKNTDDFYAKDNEHLKNIIYTILNSGTDEFTFYCDKEYKNCIDDVRVLANNRTELSNINNYVHPYNSFKEIYVTYSTKGKVNIRVVKNYTNEEIDKLNEEIDNVLKRIITKKMNTTEKIRVVHDYIIKNTKYPTDEMIASNPDKYRKATDNLFDKYSLCSGYADTMALFLEKMGIENYKIATETHVWNLVKIDKKWLHLDLTWDDPVNADKIEVLFFLITDLRLKELKVEQHDYDETVYIEAKK